MTVEFKKTGDLCEVVERIVTQSDVESTKISHKFADLAKDIFEQNVEVATWLSLYFYNKIRGERNELKERSFYFKQNLEKIHEAPRTFSH